MKEANRCGFNIYLGIYVNKALVLISLITCPKNIRWYTQNDYTRLFPLNSHAIPIPTLHIRARTIVHMLAVLFSPTLNAPFEGDAAREMAERRARNLLELRLLKMRRREGMDREGRDETDAETKGNARRNAGVCQVNEGTKPTCGNVTTRTESDTSALHCVYRIRKFGTIIIRHDTHLRWWAGLPAAGIPPARRSTVRTQCARKVLAAGYLCG